MILIVSNRRDFTVDWLVAELERRSARYVRFNTEDYPTSTVLSWRASGAGTHVRVRVRGQVAWSSSDIRAVWYRRPVPPHPPPGASPERAVWAVGEAAEALAGVWQALEPVVWVNEPERARLASGKPNQLRHAVRLGFRVPDTIISNDPDAIRQFVGGHPAGAICKPLRDGHVPADDGTRLFFTSGVTPDMVAREVFSAEPYLFQGLVQKIADVRVTVIGERVFGTRIRSQSKSQARVDWRRVDPRQLIHEPVELPQEVCAACIDLLNVYGLSFGAIDLAETGDGYVFFEVNPNGQWAWVEKLTGQPLRSALADLLEGGCD